MAEEQTTAKPEASSTKPAKKGGAATRAPRPAAEPKSTSKRGAKAKSRSAGTKVVNKSAFVRGLPGSLSAVDVISRAKAAGFSLSAGQVYSIRAAANAKARRAGSVAAPRGRGRAVSSHPAGGSAEALLRAIAAEVGLARAIEVLQSERARVLSALRGGR